jgi:prolyl 4-hydroxylase
MVSTILSRAETLLRSGRHADAAQMLGTAAGAGDSDALATLAQWRIAGNVVRRDLTAARALLARAAAAGDRGSSLLHASFLASGVGGPDQWAEAVAELTALASNEPRAAAQLTLLGAMDIDSSGFPAVPLDTRKLSSAPHVLCSEHFMTEAECSYLKSALEGALQPSLVVDPATGRMIPHPVRKSDFAVFGVHAEDLVVNALNRRIAALSGTGLDQGEPLQLLRYRAGGEYRAHLDALPPAEPNQRILTVLVYLSDDYQGGETSFPRTGLSFRGRTGDALLFRNVATDGSPDPLAIHCGLPVTHGEKLIASRWIRERRFAYPPPRPILDV